MSTEPHLWTQAESDVDPRFLEQVPVGETEDSQGLTSDSEPGQLPPVASPSHRATQGAGISQARPLRHAGSPQAYFPIGK